MATLLGAADSGRALVSVGFINHSSCWGFLSAWQELWGESARPTARLRMCCPLAPPFASIGERLQTRSLPRAGALKRPTSSVLLARLDRPSQAGCRDGCSPGFAGSRLVRLML